MAESSAPAKKTKAKAAPTHPKTLDMVVEAIKSLKDSKGSSVQAIKGYILSHYPTVSQSHLTSSLRRALKSGLESGKLVRPKGSTATGVTGRLRVGKLPEKPKKKPVKKKAPKKKPVKKPKAKKPKKADKTKKTPKKTAVKKATKKKTPKKADKKVKKPAKKATAKKTPKKASKPKKPAAKKAKK
ncbi:sperm-specific protein PHI-2B/PHI-3-like [Ptychodera flava]|uniref:sperm-specific protein PHI-2B/PHI-3-like n=1 Tax=Ptychodera flava TaxID=63121 RepID=UPI00396A3D28